MKVFPTSNGEARSHGKPGKSKTNYAKENESPLRSNSARRILLLLAQASMFLLAGLAAFCCGSISGFPPGRCASSDLALPIWIIVKSVLSSSQT